MSFASGKGVPQDFIEAYAWLNVAAASGSDKNVAAYRDELARKLSPTDLSSAQALASEYFNKYSPRIDD